MGIPNAAAGSTNVLQQLTSGAVVAFQAGATYLGITEYNGATVLSWVSEWDHAMQFTLNNYVCSADNRTATTEMNPTLDGGILYVNPMKGEVSGLTNPVIALPIAVQIRMVLTDDPTQQVVNLQTSGGFGFSYAENPTNYITFGQGAPAIDFTVLVLKK